MLCFLPTRIALTPKLSQFKERLNLEGGIIGEKEEEKEDADNDWGKSISAGGDDDAY